MVARRCVWACGVLVLVACAAVPVLAAQGDAGICAWTCQNAGQSCVVSMEKTDARCGVCKDPGTGRKTTAFETCFVPSGRCDSSCDKADKACEVGRESFDVECGKCASAMTPGAICKKPQAGRCNVQCSNKLAPCDPQQAGFPVECGQCASTVRSGDVCQEKFGKCTSKCPARKGLPCKPSSLAVPAECGRCFNITLPAEACSAGTDGICSDKCARPRAQCSRDAAAAGGGVMPEACGACQTSASTACVADDACRIAMVDTKGEELVPARVDGGVPLYDAQVRPGQRVLFTVLVLNAANGSCPGAMPTVDCALATDVKPRPDLNGKGAAYQITVNVPAGNAQSYSLDVNNCCAHMKLSLSTPGGSQCIAWGDPHIITLDQMHFSYQGFGDFVLVRTTAAAAQKVPAAEQISAHVRYVPLYQLEVDRRSGAIVEAPLSMHGMSQVSSVKAAAVKQGDTTVAGYQYHYLQNAAPKTSILLVVKSAATGVEIIDVARMSRPSSRPLSDKADLGVVTLAANDDLTVTLKYGAALTFKAYASRNSLWSSVAVRVSNSYYSLDNAGSVRGLCGDLDGKATADLHAADDDAEVASEEVSGAAQSVGSLFGQQLITNDECPRCTAIADTWRITDAAQSLFDYGGIAGLPASADLPTADFVDKALPLLAQLQMVKAGQSPVGAPPAPQVDPQVEASAREACAMFQPPFATASEYNNCLMDFIVSTLVAGDAAAGGVARSLVDTIKDACASRVGSDDSACKPAGSQCASLNYCSDHGACVAGACKCLPGFSGADCGEVAVCNDPKINKCVQGECVPTTTGDLYTCACKVGYGGQLCDAIVTPEGFFVRQGDVPAPDNRADSIPTESKGVSGGLIAAIFVVGVLLVVGAMGAVVYYRRKNNLDHHKTLAALEERSRPAMAVTAKAVPSAPAAAAAPGPAYSPAPAGPRSTYGRPAPSPRQHFSQV